MSESKTPFAVEPYGIDYICDECHSGAVVYKGFNREPMGAMHVCPVCDAEHVLAEKYPAIRFRRVTP
jgi:rubrerythrin